MCVPSRINSFTPNHFVPIVKKPQRSLNGVFMLRFPIVMIVKILLRFPIVNIHCVYVEVSYC